MAAINQSFTFNVLTQPGSLLKVVLVVFVASPFSFYEVSWLDSNFCGTCGATFEVLGTLSGTLLGSTMQRRLENVQMTKTLGVRSN